MLTCWRVFRFRAVLRVWSALLTWRVCQDNIASICAMAREYDMPRLMHSAESWLVRAAKEGTLLVPAVPNPTPESPSCAEFLRMLSLAREFKLPRFATVCKEAVSKLKLQQAQVVLNMETTEALK